MELSLVNPWCAAETEAYFSVFISGLSGNALSSEDQTLLQGFMRKSDFVPFLLSTLVSSDRNSPLSPEHAHMLALVFPQQFNKMEDLEEKMKIVEDIFSVTLFYYDGLDPKVKNDHLRTADLLANLVATIVKLFKHERISACLLQFVRQLVSFKEFYVPIQQLLGITKPKKRTDILEILVEAFEDGAEANTFMKNQYLHYSLDSLFDAKKLLLKNSNQELFTRWRGLCIAVASKPCPQTFTSNEVNTANQMRLRALTFFSDTGSISDLSPEEFQRLYAFFEVHSEGITGSLRLLYVAAFASEIVLTVATVDQAMFLIRNVFLPIISCSLKQEFETKRRKDVYWKPGIESGDRLYCRLRVLVVHWCAKRPELRGPVLTLIDEVLSCKDNDYLKFAALRLFGGLVYFLAADSENLESRVMEIVNDRILPLLEAPSTPHYCKFRALGALGHVIKHFSLSSQQLTRSYDAIIRCFQEEPNLHPQKAFCCVAMMELLEKGRNKDFVEKFRGEVLAEFTRFAMSHHRVYIDELRYCADYFLESWDESSGRSLIRALVDHCKEILVSSAKLHMFEQKQSDLNQSIASIQRIIIALGLKEQATIIITIPVLYKIFTSQLEHFYKKSLELLFTVLQAIEQPDHPAFVTLFNSIVNNFCSRYVDIELIDKVFLAYGFKKMLGPSSLSKLVIYCKEYIHRGTTAFENCLYALHSILSRLESTDLSGLDENTVKDLKYLFSSFMKSGDAYGMRSFVLVEIIRLIPSLHQKVPSTLWNFILQSNALDNPANRKYLLEAWVPYIMAPLCHGMMVKKFSQSPMNIGKEQESEKEMYLSEIDSQDFSSDDQSSVDEYDNGAQSSSDESDNQSSSDEQSDDELDYEALDPDITAMDFTVSSWEING